MKSCRLAVIASVLAAACAIADETVIPASFTTAEAPSDQEGPIGPGLRRFMWVIDSSALSGIPAGSLITGFSFRVNGSNSIAWPPGNFSFTDYEVRMSAAATTAATLSTTYATNISGSQVLLYDGALAVGANSFPAGGTAGPEGFGPTISFTGGFVYSGGNLCIDINHTGTGLPTIFLDATAGDPSLGVRGLYSGASRTAVTGIVTNTPVTRFTFVPPLAGSGTVVPSSLTTVEGSSNQEGSISGNGVRRFMYVIDPAAMAAIPSGSVILGVAYRQDSGSFSTAWPTDGITISDYEMRLSAPATTAATMSTTYASNVSGAQTLVHDGALPIPAGAFPAGPAVPPATEAFGRPISFQTGYAYFGNGLCIDINYPGTGLGATRGMDAAANDASLGVRALYSNVSRTALTGSLTTCPVTQILYAPSPEDLAKGVTKIFVVKDAATVEAAGNANTVIQTATRTLMTVAAADRLGEVAPGTDLVGIGVRGDAVSGVWPAGDQNFAQWDLQLSRSNNGPATLSTTIADNVGADAVNVRTGPLTFPTGALQALGTGPTAPFSFPIAFQVPYMYQGGPLLSVLRHSGHAGTSVVVDVVGVGDPDYLVGFNARLSTSNVATETTGLGSYPITRFDADAGTLAPLSLAGAARQNVAPSSFMSTIDCTFQVLIAASELKYVPVGSVIDSLWLRQALNGPSAPAINSTSSDIEVRLSTAALRPADMSATFATNEGADAVLVYDGALALAASTFPASGAWGKLVQFQKNFVYKGGDLCVTVRHRGFSVDSGDVELPTVAASIGRSATQNGFDSPVGGIFTGRSLSMRLGFIPSVMTPNILATAEGSSGWNMPNVSNYTVQTIIAASELRAIDVGSPITGLSLRSDTIFSSTSFPAADTNVPQFDVTLAPAAHPPLLMSATFANNIGPGQVTVRSGPMLVPARAYPLSAPNTAAENAWYVSFPRAYAYTGGDLCVTIRGQGSIVSLGFGAFDGDDTSPNVRGASVYDYSSSNALSGSFWGPLGIRLSFTVRASCPWDLNNDGVVDDADFVIFASAYDILDCNDVTMPLSCPADFNLDRVVDDVDFVAFAAAYDILVCP